MYSPLRSKPGTAKLQLQYRWTMRRYYGVGYTALVFFALLNIWSHLPSSYDDMYLNLSWGNSDRAADLNLEQVQRWRRKYHDQCLDSHTNEPELLNTLSTVLPSNSSSNRLTSFLRRGFAAEEKSDMDHLEKCSFVLIDFSTKVGDTLGDFIASRIDSCPAKGIRNNLQFDMDQLTVSTNGNVLENDFRNQSRNILKELNRYPEEYCYIGVEQNPIHTQRLQKMAKNVMSASPRPIRSVHMLTETVVTNNDGPVTVLLPSENSNGEKMTARTAISWPVHGISVRTLVERTVQQVPHGHLMIHVDSHVLYTGVLEVIQRSKILCDYRRAGVAIDLLFDNSNDITQEQRGELMGKWDAVTEQLQGCGNASLVSSD